MSEGQKARCETCRFHKWLPWFPDWAQGNPVAWEDKNDATSGSCHRFPPTGGEFPNVCAGDWCGEWQAKPVIDEGSRIELLNLGLPLQILNPLEREGICTLAGLLGTTANQLRDINHIGNKSVAKVREALRSHGLALKGE